MPGTDIAVSDDAGLTIYSLIDDGQKKLKDIKVIMIICMTNLGCSKLDILTRFQNIVLFNSENQNLRRRSIQFA